MTVRVVLASGSPRRHELPAPDRRDVRDPCSRRRRVAPRWRVPCRLRPARGPGEGCGIAHGDRRIGACRRTTVDVDSSILAKPADAREAASMLRRLSGRSHLVHTGVSVSYGDPSSTEVCTSADRIRHARRSNDRVVRGYRRAVRQGRCLRDPGRRRSAGVERDRQRQQRDRPAVTSRHRSRPRPRRRPVVGVDRQLTELTVVAKRPS